MFSEASERLNFLVFLGHRRSRFFRVPLAWFARLGWALILLSGVTLLALGFAIRNYRLATTANPTRIKELETELSEVQEAYRALESHAVDKPKERPSDEPTSAVHAAGTILGFTAYPPATSQLGIPTPETLPFKVDNLKAVWQGNQVRVTGNIQYANTDGGSQQGRILIAARGPEALVIYPLGGLNPSDKAWLIEPDQGEYFSVSRYREIRADIGPFRSHESAKEAEVLIFNQQQRLLYRSIIAIEKTVAPRPAAPKPVTPPVTAPVAPAPPAAPATPEAEP